MEKWIRARYQPNLPLDGEHRVTASRSHIALSRQVAQEGAVLLKNDAELLPLAPGTRVALFGKGSFDYVKGGGGSGNVTVAYTRNLYDGLKGEGVPLYEPLSDFYRNYVAGRYQAGDVPGLMAEPELPQDLVDAAREQAEVAVIVLSRFSGEGWDREPVLYQEPDYPWPDELEMPKRAMKNFPKGDFYLTDAEQNMVRQVRTAFAQVVLVLNVGGVMDVSWFWEDDRIPSVLLACQGGMEGARPSPPYSPEGPTPAAGCPTPSPGTCPTTPPQPIFTTPPTMWSTPRTSMWATGTLRPSRERGSGCATPSASACPTPPSPWRRWMPEGRTVG